MMALMLAGCIKADAPASLAEKGEELSNTYGCVSCHSIDGTRSVAPTWKGLYGSVVHFDDETSAVAGIAYLTESIKDPSAKTVKDFPNGLMETVIKRGSVPDDEVKALIAYIEALR